ncbi:MAG: hypothetical protein R3C01_16825 [Planctomycetaceae bacterium]
MITQLLKDEAGFVVSAELVLVATLVVIGLVVGLSSIQHALNAELNDVADAIGNLNQSYSFSGFSKSKNGGRSIYSRGSSFTDTVDECDNDQCMIDCDNPVYEGPKYNND